ncbi:hypothetical protein J2Z66_002172 [Paenibacillus eucommiae]|uniref:Uncharacterized protein n=1 Tax=Paenibacillus eucommiae TaxID=1355755 RepID=A0ABS4IUN1_9BACL|nr:hypothetical protein [Paenibacillus eucommiae]
MENDIFQSLLGEIVEEVHALDPGYSGHASDVWLVKTSANEVIVRSSRLKEEPDNDFWWGCKFLFGVDPRSAIYIEKASGLLNKIATIPAH